MKKFLLLLFLTANTFASLPTEFVYLQDVAPEIEVNLRYATTENFVGRKVKGYDVNNAIIKLEAGLALKAVNDDLMKDGYRLVVYDSYRPQKAVDDFVEWSKTTDESTKQYYYPSMEKKDIFRRGFVATKSSHSLGNTVDVTIIEVGKTICPVYKKNNRIYDCTLDMGMHWDFFGEESYFQSSLVNYTHNQRRKYLREKMEKHGFKGVSGEWWHFSFKNIN